jgi:multidrug efflux pump subunit AcrA (membrane-fusion protein)
MFGRVEILLRSNPEATLIPIQALVTEGDKDYVFLYKNGKVYRRAIQKGLVRDTTVEVTRGASPGDQVVVTGYGSLKDGMSVRLLPKTEQAG